MGKSKALIVALVMLVAGAFLLTLDPAVSTPSVAAVARAVVPVEPPTPVPKLVNGGLALPLSAEAFISVYVPAREVGKGDGAKLEILTEKNATKPWPLASLSKLFTAMAIVDNGGLSDGLTLTAVDVPNAIDVGLFHPGEIFRRQDLMDSMLIESSNNAATALANQVGAETFLAQLNAKSAELGLANTHFFTPHGLDIEGLGASNYSTAQDLVKAAVAITADYPDIWDITRLLEYRLTTADGVFHHQVVSTNKLLDTATNWPAAVVGGKTGQTELAKKNLLLVLRDNKTGGYLINVVLGATDHFADMVTLTNWVYQSYEF